MRTGTYSVCNGQYEAVLDGVKIKATWNSKGAAEAGIEVERRRRAKKAEEVQSLLSRYSQAQAVANRPGPYG